ncbi:MAG: CBS domain-containing protein [Gammaproteobacteria bacterium]|nr:CBS domain-containing protein [Gammaproteobacteria bacterium]MCF6229516.1 CBS domain-containing protein [Gammaproteobacteria bacterium]
MAANYTPIPQSTLARPTSITPPSTLYTMAITEESPAFKVMSDLKLTTPATTHANSTLKNANQQMINRGVRMLFVVDEVRQLQGIITSNDLLGEKPVQYMRSFRCGAHEITVKQLMTPLSEIEVLDYSDIERAKVGDIISTLKESGRHHALIGSYQSDGSLTICGTFSLSHISQLMNTQTTIAGSPKTTITERNH